MWRAHTQGMYSSNNLTYIFKHVKSLQTCINMAKNAFLQALQTTLTTTPKGNRIRVSKIEEKSLIFSTNTCKENPQVLTLK